MVECSTRSFCVQTLQFISGLFTELFHKNFSSLIRVNCSYVIHTNTCTPHRYTNQQYWIRLCVHSDTYAHSYVQFYFIRSN